MKFKSKKNNQNDSQIIIPTPEEISKINQEIGPQFTGLVNENGEAIYRATEPMSGDVDVVGNDPRYSTVSFVPNKPVLSMSPGGILTVNTPILVNQENILHYEGSDEDKENLEQITHTTFAQQHPTLARVGQFARKAAPYVGAAAGLIVVGLPSIVSAQDTHPTFDDILGQQPTPTDTKITTNIVLPNTCGFLSHTQPSFINAYLDESEDFRLWGSELRLMGYMSDLSSLLKQEERQNSFSRHSLHRIGLKWEQGNFFKEKERMFDTAESVFNVKNAYFGDLAWLAAFNPSPKAGVFGKNLTALGLFFNFGYMEFGGETELLERTTGTLGLEYLGLYGPLQIQAQAGVISENDKKVFGICSEPHNFSDLGFAGMIRASYDFGNLLGGHLVLRGHANYNNVNKTLTGTVNNFYFEQNENRQDFNGGLEAVYAGRGFYVGASWTKYWQRTGSNSEQAPVLNQISHDEHYTSGLNAGLRLPSILGENAWLGLNLYLDHDQNQKKWSTRDNFGVKGTLTINF